MEVDTVCITTTEYLRLKDIEKGAESGKSYVRVEDYKTRRVIAYYFLKNDDLVGQLAKQRREHIERLEARLLRIQVREQQLGIEPEPLVFDEAKYVNTKLND